MKILLIGPDMEENLSLEYLASSLEKNGYQPIIGAFNSSEDIEKVVAMAKSADVIGLSLVFQGRAIEFLTVAQLKRSAPKSQ